MADDYRKTLAETAKTSDKDVKDQFNLRYGDEVVDALDKRYNSMMKLWQMKRLSCEKSDCVFYKEKYMGKKFATTDAFVCGVDGRFYFIEFKYQPVSNIKLDNLWNKAFESPLAVSFDLLADVPMKKVREKSVFVVVYREDPNVGGEGQKRLNGLLDEYRSGEKVNNEQVSIKFGLTPFKSGEHPIYSAIYTLTEKEFDDLCEQVFGPCKRE